MARAAAILQLTALIVLATTVSHCGAEGSPQHGSAMVVEYSSGLFPEDRGRGVFQELVRLEDDSSLVYYRFNPGQMLDARRGRLDATGARDLLETLRATGFLEASGSPGSAGSGCEGDFYTVAAFDHVVRWGCGQGPAALQEFADSLLERGRGLAPKSDRPDHVLVTLVPSGRAARIKSKGFFNFVSARPATLADLPLLARLLSRPGFHEIESWAASGLAGLDVLERRQLYLEQDGRVYEVQLYAWSE